MYKKCFISVSKVTEAVCLSSNFDCESRAFVAKIWYTWEDPNFIEKTSLSLIRNKVLVAGNILFVNKRWILIAKGGTHNLTGSTYCFKGKISPLSHRKNISCEKL